MPIAAKITVQYRFGIKNREEASETNKRLSTKLNPAANTKPTLSICAADEK